MLRKLIASMQIYVVIVFGICHFAASYQGENIHVSNADVVIGEIPARYARRSYGADIPREQRQMGRPGLGLFGVNLFEKVATDTANVLSSVNQQIGNAFNQFSRPYTPGQPGLSFGIGLNSGYPAYVQNPYTYGQSVGQPILPYGYPPQPQGSFNQLSPHGGSLPDSYEHHHHGHGHGHDHHHNHGQGFGENSGYASGYEHSHYHGNGHGHGGGNGHKGEYGQGHHHGHNMFQPPPHRFPGQENSQQQPSKTPKHPSTNAGNLNGASIPMSPAPPSPPLPVPPPPTVLPQPQFTTSTALPPLSSTQAVVASQTSDSIPSSTTEDIEDVTYDIDIRGEFDANQTRRRRQLFPNLFNSIGNIVQTGVNLANPANYQQTGQQPVLSLFGGFGQRPTNGQNSLQYQPGQSTGFPQQTSQRVPRPPSNGSPQSQHTVNPPIPNPPQATRNPDDVSQTPELNLQTLGTSDFTWTPENIAAHRVRRDSDAIFFPDDDIFERPLPIRAPVNPTFNPVVKQPSGGSQAGAQSQSQNSLGGFEQNSGSQSQSQTVQNALGLFNQNSAGSTSGNIATDGSSGQLSAANTMQQSFQTADSSGSKNSAQSQSANFDKKGSLALTSSNANTNSVREKDKFKEESNAGSSSALQNEHGMSASNAQTNSETFLENGIQGSKNSASSQSQQTNKDGSVSGSTSNTSSNTFTGPNGLQGSSSSSQSSSFNQGQGGGAGASSTAMSSSSSTGGGSFSISGSFSGTPPFNVFPNWFNQLKGK